MYIARHEKQYVYFAYLFLYVCMHTCKCTYMQCLWRAEEGFVFP